MIKIVIDKKTPSINHLHGHNKFGNFYLKKEGRELKKYILEKVKNQVPKTKLKSFQNTKLSIIVEVYENWYTKKGTVKRADLANKEKFLTDSVFDALGLDDCFIFEYTMKKIQSKDERTIIYLELFGKNK
jgi:Holliday junction resolvase RusA-like endonuclease